MTLTLPIPADGLEGAPEVLSALADVLLDELSLTADTNPVETEPLPQQAPKAWAERKSLSTPTEQAYWWLTWRGSTPGIRTFGNPMEYTRQTIDAVELAGSLPLDGQGSRAPEWNAAVRNALNAIEGNRRLGGRILSIDRPILVDNRVRSDSGSPGQTRTGFVRYHYALIRFNVRTTDRIFLTQG